MESPERKEHRCGMRPVKRKAKKPERDGDLSLSKNLKLAVSARKQRFAGLREKCCSTKVRGSAPITPAGGSASCTSAFLTP